MPTPHVDDAIAFIVEFAEHPRNDGYSTYGYELYMPQVIAAYIKEVEHSTDHPTHIHNSPRVVELSPIFYEAGWELCRRGILRPGLKRMGLQATEDGASGNGYSLISSGGPATAKAGNPFGARLCQSSGGGDGVAAEPSWG